MRILIACEKTQAVCIEMRKRGHEAYSCDIQDCSGGHPEWHIKGDALELLNGRCTFTTMDGATHTIPDIWDLIIAHPPCTDLACSGAKHFAVKRADGRQQRSIEFFMAFTRADCPRIAIENPVGIMSTQWRKPDQIITPWQFAIDEDENTEKKTCLWLKGMKPLKPLHTVRPEIEYHEWIAKDGRKKRQTKWYYNTRCQKHKHRGELASKTFPGIARAMAEQWTDDLTGGASDD